MYESETELLAALQATSKSVSKALTGGKALVKALDRLSEERALERPDLLAEAVEALKEGENRIFWGPGGEDLVHALEARVRQLRATAHHQLLSGLLSRLANPEHMKVVSDSPLVLYLHPLTLEVHFEQFKGTLMYAREPLATTSLDPEEILSAHTVQVEQFRGMRIDSRQFWNVCKLAYEMVLLKNGLPRGSRVDIVELLAPLTWLWPVQGQFKKGTGMPRFLLAYQIQKLRQDGMLAQQGVRLDLGSATGGSTRNKANVLYIPFGPTEGQYYLSLCFGQG